MLRTHTQRTWCAALDWQHQHLKLKLSQSLLKSHESASVLLASLRVFEHVCFNVFEDCQDEIKP